MFENIGAKIKGLAAVITWIGIIGSIIGGIVTINSGSQMSYYGGGNPLIVPGILLMILGSLGAWIGSFLLYGFGQLIEHAASIDDKLRNLANTLIKQGEKHAWRDEYKVADNQANKGTKLPETPNTEIKKVQVVRTPSGFTCPNCQAWQNPDRTVCFKCGARFIDSDGNDDAMPKV